MANIERDNNRGKMGREEVSKKGAEAPPHGQREQGGKHAVQNRSQDDLRKAGQKGGETSGSNRRKDEGER